MIKYYSQNGEDAVLWTLFEGKQETGFFIEVGALDGKRFSNTYSFEEEGWKGICIEAHKYYFDLLKKNRKNSICINAAISDHEVDEVEFYANKRGSLSTLNKQLEPFFRNNYAQFFSGFEVQKVQMRTLDSILSDIEIPKEIDLVSIDVEGHELEVLAGFNIKKYQPKIIIVECVFIEKMSLMDEKLNLVGYHKARKMGVNIFYCRDKEDVDKISNANAQVKLIHAKHPLD